MGSGEDQCLFYLIVLSVAKDYVRLMKYGDSMYRCKQLKRAALGRMCTILKRQKSSLEYLEQGSTDWLLTIILSVLSKGFSCFSHLFTLVNLLLLLPFVSASASVPSAVHRPQHEDPAPVWLPQCREVEFYQQGTLMFLSAARFSN